MAELPPDVEQAIQELQAQLAQYHGQSQTPEMAAGGGPIPYVTGDQVATHFENAGGPPSQTLHSMPVHGPSIPRGVLATPEQLRGTGYEKILQQLLQYGGGDINPDILKETLADWKANPRGLHSAMYMASGPEAGVADYLREHPYETPQINNATALLDDMLRNSNPTSDTLYRGMPIETQLASAIDSGAARPGMTFRMPPRGFTPQRELAEDFANKSALGGRPFLLEMAPGASTYKIDDLPQRRYAPLANEQEQIGGGRFQIQDIRSEPSQFFASQPETRIMRVAQIEPSPQANLGYRNIPWMPGTEREASSGLNQLLLHGEQGAVTPKVAAQGAGAMLAPIIANAVGNRVGGEGGETVKNAGIGYGLGGIINPEVGLIGAGIGALGTYLKNQYQDHFQGHPPGV